MEHRYDFCNAEIGDIISFHYRNKIRHGKVIRTGNFDPNYYADVVILGNTNLDANTEFPYFRVWSHREVFLENKVRAIESAKRYA
ncbi:hypothetical protein HY637_02785 [Candidatus Woesearchaeota archaeon]|nr:hypothetical protein [Candidatus Woesearchaeota archaeon]